MGVQSKDMGWEVSVCRNINNKPVGDDHDVLVCKLTNLKTFNFVTKQNTVHKHQSYKLSIKNHVSKIIIFFQKHHILHKNVTLGRGPRCHYQQSICRTHDCIL